MEIQRSAGPNQEIETTTMQWLDLTLADPAANLALDEALLERAEASEDPAECLRVWESSDPLVVVGRGSSLATEVDLSRCAHDHVPVLRRCSGGAAIVAARGCLFYALVLNFELRPALRKIDQAHEFVLGEICAALAGSDADLELAGTSDLAVRGRKVSGNSLRLRRRHLLYHGTLLYDMALPLATRYLHPPPREPDYRAGRSHADFIANLNVGRAELMGSLRRQWNAQAEMGGWPEESVDRLVDEKYGQEAWTRSVP
ncbi:MAG: lipoate--protein ligase family protein [Planctomycetota bacterium]|mgnify:CR=1 FL=1|nr:MAG: lipoate--protein ligase family protein [Planctomycetota bacterium]REK39757.1 MAG: lipoate--protein ligase family protein [Planctomycetota bacterium]